MISIDHPRGALPRGYRFGMLLLLVVVTSLGAAAKEASIDYTVSIPDPKAELFSVIASLHNVTPDTLRFFFPVWAPGAYDVVNFGAFIRDLSARDAEGRALTVRRVDTGEYVIVDPPKHLTISYMVDDIEALDNSPWFGLSDIEDSTRIAFANGPALFGYPEGFKEIPYTVTYVPPIGWDLAVALPLAEVRNNAHPGGLTFTARSYDELVDAPVQMGAFQSWTFEVNGIPHTITVTAPNPISDETGEELVAMTRQAIEIFSDFFGEMPYERYLFQFYFVRPVSFAQGFGALEHAGSSTYQMPYSGEETMVDEMMPVVAHEYWHLWSPKRFHVAALGPFDYRKPPATASLWFHEGLTEYYAHLLMARHGMITPTAFLGDFAGRLGTLNDTSQREPITELSRTLPYREIGDIYALYVKGPVLGFLLDIVIRAQTENERSLDDAMRHFNKEYGDHRGAKEFTDDDIIPIIEEATGAKVADFYARYIDGVERPPIERLLSAAGLTPLFGPDLGALLRATSGGWEVRYLNQSGIVGSSGLRMRDTIVAFLPHGGDPVTATGIPSATKLTTLLNDWAGTAVTIRFKRAGEMMETPLVMRWQIESLTPDPNASELAREIRESMMGI